MSRECRTKPEDLKCSHCNTTGKHNTNDFCKNFQGKKKEDEKKGGKGKANTVLGKEEDESPADESEEEGKAWKVTAERYVI